MKDLLLLTCDDPAEPARVEMAIRLARQLDATITCLDVDESSLLHDEVAGYTADGRALQQLVRSQACGNRERLKGLFAREKMAVGWVEREGRVRDELPTEAAFHDLTIVSAAPASLSSKHGSAIVSALVCQSRSPALLLPDDISSSDLNQRAIVAWDGSTPCIAALRAAMPLLAATEQVSVVQVGACEHGATIQRAADYLKRHGVFPHVEELPEDWEASRTLLARCRPGRVSYCVMGAFSRWRGIERAFGGTTIDMIAKSRVPLFIAH